MKILIAEDDPVSRRILEETLKGWGHEVVAAVNGVEAWGLFEQGGVSFIISDWMMPEMDGAELCRRVRSRESGSYVYFILLTACGASDDLVEGMTAGADDFIVKPFDRRELEVRMRAGIRVIELEHGLLEKSRELAEANTEMETDLRAAAELQRSLLPDAIPDVPGYRFSWYFRPCTFVAGDMLDIFQLDENHWGFYLLDVSGHGVRPALLSVTVSRFLLPIEGQSSMVRYWDPLSRRYEVVPPVEVVASLRRRFPYDQLENLYFTLTYGVLDVRNGEINCIRAGNPNPLVVRADGPTYSFPEGGGAAIGLFPAGIVPDEPIELTLAPGDRLYLYSDGIVEALDSHKGIFSGDRLAETLLRHHAAPIDEATSAAVDMAGRWSGSARFDDDVSILGIECSPVAQPFLASCRTMETPLDVTVGRM